MAKRKGSKGDDGAFIPGLNIAGSLRARKHDSLFLPTLLAKEAGSWADLGKAKDAAYAVLVKWADLESSGQLAKIKETSANADFLNTVFGDALGYKAKTDDPTDFGVEREYHVPGVGPVDGALGPFPKAKSPLAIIELKSSDVDLDRDKSNGRTAVQQAWDYLNALPDCPWAIVSNFSVIRLYHRTKTQRAYEEFTLQKLRDRDTFNEFYWLFKRSSMFPTAATPKAPIVTLLEKTGARQKQVGESLYKSYRDQRNNLIAHLVHDQRKPLDTAIRIAQKLLDRVVFIAFCEDRGLLPPDTLERAWSQVPAYSKVTNPRWQNFVGLFRLVDKGGEEIDLQVGFNGGLFKHDPDVDDLDLADTPFANALKGFGTYDFAQEVNVEVLGHLFERSITELEKLRVAGTFALTAGDDQQPPEERSAQRKRMGIYYTPPAFTGLIVHRTIDALVEKRFDAHAAKHGVDRDTGKNAKGAYVSAYWRDCLATLRDLKVIDPACGSGAFLIRAYDALESHYNEVVGHIILSEKPREDDARILRDSIPDWILTDNLHGVDLSEEGVEITQLALWIRSARKGRTLRDLSHNIICGNSLIDDPAVHPRAMEWKKDAFPEVFKRGGDRAGFDCVIGNPPWERMKLEEREFFALSAPAIATSANASDRKKLIAKLEGENPELWSRYIAAQSAADRSLAYVRTKAAGFPLTARGDINTYMLFAELAERIVAPGGRVGLLVPSGIATDHSTKDFFGSLVSTKRLVAIYDFVNRYGLFPDVEGRLKFCVLLFNGPAAPSESIDFVFWAERIEELSVKSRHVALSARDIELINPNTLTCPIFRTQRQANLAKAVYKRVPVLMNDRRKEGGNPWGVAFYTMFHQTNDAACFITGDQLKADGFRKAGNRWAKGKTEFLPLIEAKMTREFDHRASWVVMNDQNAYMNYTAESTTLVEHQNPEWLPSPRYWVNSEEVARRSPVGLATTAIGFHDIARSNDSRTMVACAVPYAAFSNKLPLVLNAAELSWRRFCCLLGNFGSYVYDFLVRQKAGGANLNFFIVEQIPTLPPDTYADKCPWSKRETLEHWISERVLKLSCTANDMIPLAEACGFKGSTGRGVHIWKESERRELRTELDAAYFHLYGVEREDAAYMLSTFNHTGYILPDNREKGGPEWEKGSIGEMVLDAYDALAAGR